MGAFKIDGKEYNVRVLEDGVERAFNKLYDENTGRLLDAVMHIGLIGVFFNYTIKMDATRLNKQEYDEMYEVLTDTQDFHTIEVPYAQGTLVYEAYISSGKDTLKSMKNGNEWHGLSINFIARAPEKRA